jgi:signal transduction histidine kinase
VTGHRPVRTRLIAASILGIVAALATFVVMITVRYRDGLEQRLRADLTSGASALRAARTPEAFKAAIGSLAAAGISVDLAGITANGGTLQTTPGEALLTVHEVIPVGGRDVPAALTGSLAGIDRQVRSLEVTEAIGGVIALALLVALARVLVLLDRAVSEARASEAAMRTFLADASHELRTPVAERIFEPFVRLPRSPRGGTGLGLAIVRRTIESHGGTITCDPSPTGGARFTLRLPANS